MCKRRIFEKNARTTSKKEGCNVHGKIVTQRGIGLLIYSRKSNCRFLIFSAYLFIGNFNIVVGDFIIQNSRYLFDSEEFKHFKNEDGHYTINSSHIIHHLSFGKVCQWKFLILFNSYSLLGISWSKEPTGWGVSCGRG